MIGVINDIEGQGGPLNEALAEEAMWLQGLQKNGKNCEMYGKNAHLSAAADKGYWYGMYQCLKIDIPNLQRLIRGTGAANGRPDKIALFPRHATSVLVAIGRTIGDASHITQFQFHRDRVAGNPGGQWAWSNNARPNDDKYKVQIINPPSGDSSEAFLKVSLTASIDNAELPAHLYNGRQLALPSIEIVSDTLSTSAIGHPYDLEIFGKALDEAYRTIQDVWNIKKIHLVVIAPATACVRVGQKMQARTQGDITLYERDPLIDGKPFVPTLTLTPTKIRLSSGEEIGLN
ncbi:MAG: SAVED domain-containing protein [Methylophilaceae bacterium]